MSRNLGYVSKQYSDKGEFCEISAFEIFKDDCILGKWPRAYKQIPCSTQLSMKNFKLIIVKMPTIVLAF